MSVAILVDSSLKMELGAASRAAGGAADCELVRAAKLGDIAAREELARRYRQPAFVLALQLLGNREDSLDVAHDALLRFFQKLGRFDAERPVLPWLRRIVRNRVIDLQRRRRVRRAESLDSGGPEGEALEIEDPHAAEGMDVGLRQRQQIVWQCLGELAPAQREIVVLRDYQDLSYQEISELLGIPIGTVMSRLHRSRAELRRRVLERLGLPFAADA